MSAKHPSCAVHVRFRPADYLRIRNASLSLEITPERFVRALVLSAMEFYDRENPGEPAQSKPLVTVRGRHDAWLPRVLKIDPQERQERSKRIAAINKARVADIPPELMDEYRKLRKRIPAEAARMIIEKRMEDRAYCAKMIKRKLRKERARERSADPEYHAKTLGRGRDAMKQRVVDIPTQRNREYRRLQQLFGADEAKRIIGEEVRRKVKAGAE